MEPTTDAVREHDGTRCPAVPPCAASQAGVFSLTQAFAAGITRGIARGHQRSGRWVKVLGRGWTVKDQPIGVLQRCWAAAVTYPEGVIVGPTALLAWTALDRHLLPPLPLAADDSVWVSGPTPRRQQAGITWRQTPAAVALDWPTHGLRLADPFDSIIDTLAMVPEPEADSLFAWLVSRGQIQESALDRGITRYRHRTGCLRLQRYREYASTGAASELESRLHLLLRRAGITGWKANAKIRLAERTVSVDVLFDDTKLVLEADGFSSHSSRDSFHSDRRRSRDLVAAGYQVLTFTWQDITQRPAEAIAQITSVLHSQIPSQNG